MNKQTWKQYVFWIVLAELVGGLSGWLTRGGAARRSIRRRSENRRCRPPARFFQSCGRRFSH